MVEKLVTFIVTFIYKISFFKNTGRWPQGKIYPTELFIIKPQQEEGCTMDLSAIPALAVMTTNDVDKEYYLNNVIIVRVKDGSGKLIWWIE